MIDQNKKAQLTVSGRLLLNQGRELLKSGAILEDAVQQIETGWETRIRIAINSILPIEPLLEQVTIFTKLDKCVQVDIHEEVLGGTWESLVSNRCDLVLGPAGDSSLHLPTRSSGLFESRQTIRVASMPAKIKTQSLGTGIGVLPKHLIRSELNFGKLAALPCNILRPKVPLYIAWKKENKGRASNWFVSATQTIRWLD